MPGAGIFRKEGFYKERMADIPVVLIHGYPFDHTMWFSTIAALGNKARVIAPDLPGFGRNPVLQQVSFAGIFGGFHFGGTGARGL